MTEDEISYHLEQSKEIATNTETKTKTTASYTIEFRTKTISITNESLCINLLKINTLQKEQKEKPNWNVLIQEYDTISDLIQQEMSTSLSQSTMSDYKRLKQYVTYNKLQLLLQRNEHLVKDLLKKKQKWEDITHVYMLLLQDARSVVTCLQDSTDDECFLLAQAQVIRYRALYSCSLAHCYASSMDTNVEEYYHKAKGLYEHSLELASMAAEELSACRDVDELVNGMVELETEITGARCRLEACRYLKSGVVSQLPLLQRLNDSTLILNHDKKTKPFYLVDGIQTYRHVPCKPTFFDLAWNYIEEMDPTKEELQKYIEDLEVKEKGGSSRFLGWFYR